MKTLKMVLFFIFSMLVIGMALDWIVTPIWNDFLDALAGRR